MKSLLLITALVLGWAAAGQAQTLHIETVSRLVDGDGFAILAPFMIAGDENGHVYVADQRQSKIGVYDKEGVFLRSIGRSGQGPGEFQMISGIGYFSGHLAVLDQQLMRVTVIELASGSARTEAYKPLFNLLSPVAVRGQMHDGRPTWVFALAAFTADSETFSNSTLFRRTEMDLKPAADSALELLRLSDIARTEPYAVAQHGFPRSPIIAAAGKEAFCTASTIAVDGVQCLVGSNWRHTTLALYNGQPVTHYTEAQYHDAMSRGETGIGMLSSSTHGKLYTTVNHQTLAMAPRGDDFVLLHSVRNSDSSFRLAADLVRDGQQVRLPVLVDGNLFDRRMYYAPMMTEQGYLAYLDVVDGETRVVLARWSVK